MRTPREILLRRHLSANPKLDDVRTKAVSAALSHAPRAERPAGRAGPWPVGAARAAWRELLARESRLRALCLTGPDATLRDSCIILTQAYGAFHPSPDLDWLGLPRHLLEPDLAALRHRITGSRTSEPVERIALLDCGAGAGLCDQRFEDEHGLAVLFKDYHLSLLLFGFRRMGCNHVLRM